jgi:hypothetical protein
VAARFRQKNYELPRTFGFSPGSLVLTHRRCGKPTCHCASGEGHPIWFLGFTLAKSRWEIENRGFNDGKNRYGMERICHHHPNSIPIVWLLIALALGIERLHRLRFLHRGEHGIRSAMKFWNYLGLTPGSRSPLDPG